MPTGATSKCPILIDTIDDINIDSPPRPSQPPPENRRHQPTVASHRKKLGPQRRRTTSSSCARLDFEDDACATINHEPRDGLMWADLYAPLKTVSRQ